jgi:hypothetical protein
MVQSYELGEQLAAGISPHAVIPAAGSPEEKIQAILDWMAHGPARLRSGSALKLLF